MRRKAKQGRRQEYKSRIQKIIINREVWEWVDNKDTFEKTRRIPQSLKN